MNSTTHTRRVSGAVRRGIAFTVMAVAALVLSALPASAHVGADGKTDASGITTVTLSFAHGCSGSPTTSMKVEIPAGTTEITPQNPAGWTSTIGADALTWTGGPIDDGTPGEFVVTMRVVGASGETIFLPTIQGCESGSNNWIEKTEDPEADDAAPRITLTQTVAPATTVTSAGSASTTRPETSTTQTSTTGTEASASDEPANENANESAGPLIIFILVIVVIVGGALVLYLRNRKPKPSAP